MPTSTATTTTIEVCQGPDCLGGGGGAVILEMEELVQEHTDSDDVFRVRRGGCRNLCSVGPNVHVTSNQSDRIHIANVHNLHVCHDDVVEKAGLISQTSSGSSVLQTMLHKKSLRFRWQLLRDMSRFSNATASTSGGGNNRHLEERIREELKESYNAELASARGCPEMAMKKERAVRRLARFESMIERMLERQMDVSSSSSDDDDDVSDDEKF